MRILAVYGLIMALAPQKTVQAPVLSPAQLKGEPYRSALREVNSRFEQTWFPSSVLKDLTLLAVVSYADGARFVVICDTIRFSQEGAVFGDVRIQGPAVVWPLLNKGEPKFKKLRYLPEGTDVYPDMKSPHLFIAEEGTSFVLISTSAVHGAITGVDYGDIGPEASKAAVRTALGG